MDEARGSDISKTQLDLVDLSAMEQSDFGPVDESLHPIIGPKGFCVKEYEERMQTLEKENFNLKLRIYFLEDKNPNIPEGAETLYKQNIDLKIENENLLKDLNDKQELLCQASKALELLDEQKGSDLHRSQMMVEELNQKIESLQYEVSSLQNALTDANKSQLANDTGYADFLGAVDSKDLEVQRKMQELAEVEARFNREVLQMNDKIAQLQAEKSEIEEKASNLIYDNEEMKDKMQDVEKRMTDQLKTFHTFKQLFLQKFHDLDFSRHENENILKENQVLSDHCTELQYLVLEKSFHQDTDGKDYVAKLEKELHEYKEKWAETQCDLQDAQDSLKSTEAERLKTIAVLKATIEALDKQRDENFSLKKELAEITARTTSKSFTKAEAEGLTMHQNGLFLSQVHQISDLKVQLHNAMLADQKTKQDLAEKVREIEKLTSRVNSTVSTANGSNASRMSLEQLSESFNDLKVQQALEERKMSVQKMADVMNDLASHFDQQTKDHALKLQKQLNVVIEKQEVTDSALEKCAELCFFSLEHLNELARFLTALLQNREFRESLGNTTMQHIESALNKTLELTEHASRFSLGGNMSLLSNLSSLDILMTTTRISLAHVNDMHTNNKSVQAENGHQIQNMKRDMDNLSKELEDLNRVNQLLEDEICRLKDAMQEATVKMEQRDAEVKQLKKQKQEFEDKCGQAVMDLHALTVDHEKVVADLQAETVKKIEFESKACKSEQMATVLREKLEILQSDVEVNWITKHQHEIAVHKLEDDIISGEAQVAAIRMEMDGLRKNLSESKDNWNLDAEMRSLKVDEDKENVAAKSTRRTLEISGGTRQRLLDNSEELVPAHPIETCPMCPKYQGKIAELKKFLGRAVEKIKIQNEIKAQNDRHIQKQLTKTESFLHQARAGMETIWKAHNLEKK